LVKCHILEKVKDTLKGNLFLFQA